MHRFFVAFVLALLPLSCGGSGQHASGDQNQHHGEGHSQHHGEGHSDQHKHKHGEGVHKHKHGGDEDHSKHQHGADPLGHRFQDAEKWAERFDDPKRDAWQMPTQVVALMEIEPGMQVADIGAGTGYFLPHLAAKAGASGAVLGLDIEEDMVRYMMERAEREKLKGVSARVVATDDPGFTAASMDRILIVDTWHHIPARVAYLKRLALGLKAGGTITIVDFTMETTRGPPKSHRLTSESILAECQEAGLAAELLSETLPDQYVVRVSKSAP